MNISVAVNRLTMATYLGQKEAFIEEKGEYATWFPVLLRFKTKAEWANEWRRDPDDNRAFQLQNTLVPADEIEYLDVGGWLSLAEADLNVRWW
jgi:hypothetical protein